jgi:hypothetical protein
MCWCELNGVDFVFGLAKKRAPSRRRRGPNSRRPRQRSWSGQRRVIAMAEWTAGVANPALCRHVAGCRRRRLAAAL